MRHVPDSPPVSVVAQQVADEWLSHGDVAAAPHDDYGAMLRAYRLASGLSQASLAAMLGMTQQNLSQIEGGRAPSLAQRQRMVEVLGLAPRIWGWCHTRHPSSTPPTTGRSHGVVRGGGPNGGGSTTTGTSTPRRAAVPGELASPQHSVDCALQLVPRRADRTTFAWAGARRIASYCRPFGGRAENHAGPAAACRGCSRRPLHRSGQAPRPTAAVRVASQLPAP